ncbi:MAG: hypothetical protein JJU11_05800, partial [Candidatus Sumerlaeia bacterium]|nr:hypothetical protein [Candidatus Sumerlaeia bacterium]
TSAPRQNIFGRWLQFDFLVSDGRVHAYITNEMNERFAVGVWSDPVSGTGVYWPVITVIDYFPGIGDNIVYIQSAEIYRSSIRFEELLATSDQHFEEWPTIYSSGESFFWESTFKSEDIPPLRDSLYHPNGTFLDVQGVVQDFKQSTEPDRPHEAIIVDASLPSGLPIVFWENTASWVQDLVPRLKVGSEVQFSGITDYSSSRFSIRANADSVMFLLGDAKPKSLNEERRFLSEEFPALSEVKEEELGKIVTIEGVVISYVPSPAPRTPHRVTISDSSLPEGLLIVFWDNQGDWVAESVPHLVPGKRIRFTGLTSEHRGDFQIRGVEDSMLEILEDPPSAD